MSSVLVLTKGGYTALLVASPKGKVDIVTALLNHGANVDVTSERVSEECECDSATST